MQTGIIKEDNFNDLYREIIQDVLVNGKHSAPRGMGIKEIIFHQFILTDPTKSLCTIKARKLNYAFSIIEKMEYLTGINIPERLIFYNSNISNFINKETNQFDGAYAPRFGRQLMYIYNLLKKDPDSRQAVLNINNETDNHESKDIACTVSLQFLLRDNHLNLIVYMRSNDVLWGTPYDVNAFSFIQEVMASWLGVKLGHYHHINGSTHIYDTTKLKLVDTLGDKNTIDISNPRWLLDSPAKTYDQLSRFWFFEDQYRHGNFDLDDTSNISSDIKLYLEVIKDYCKKKLNK